MKVSWILPFGIPLAGVAVGLQPSHELDELDHHDTGVVRRHQKSVSNLTQRDEF